MNTVLIIEDEDVLRLTFERFLDEDGYDVGVAANYDEALAYFDGHQVDVVVSDIILGGKTGIDLLREINDRDLDTQVIMITGEPSTSTATEALRLGAFDYLAKPVTGADLKRVVRLAIGRKEVIAERNQYRNELEAIFNSVTSGLIAVDQALCVRQVNMASEQLFGLTAESCDGVHASKIGAGCLGPVLDALEESVSSGASASDIRLEVALPEGTRILIADIVPLVSGAAGPGGAIAVFRDVTRITYLEQQLQEHKSHRTLVGQSRGMREIYQLIEDLADTDSTVLICGESGTGKELIAEAIHASSSRAEKPFVKVNCAALSDDLLDSELFGHVKGAFTGAIKDRVGRFEAAHRGTIFLDEIGDISPRLQLRLLRVLQNGEFERVGDSQTKKVDARVLAATNQDLKKRIVSEAFRQDLYYRLNVIRIDIPPLRERKEDIPALLEHFCRHFNAVFEKEITGFSPEALSAVMNYPWYGNARELENCVERAFIVCHDTQVRAEHLPTEVAFENGLGRRPQTNDSVRSGRAALNREIVLEVLSGTDWNVAKTARSLGIARNTLYQKMKEYDLSRPTNL